MLQGSGEPRRKCGTVCRKESLGKRKDPWQNLEMPNVKFLATLSTSISANFSFQFSVFWLEKCCFFAFSVSLHQVSVILLVFDRIKETSSIRQRNRI